jgi:hypothetical protein
MKSKLLFVSIISVYCHSAIAQLGNNYPLKFYVQYPQLYPQKSQISNVKNIFGLGIGAGIDLPVKKSFLSINAVYQPRYYSDNYVFEKDSLAFETKQVNKFHVLYFPLEFLIPIKKEKEIVYLKVGYGFSKVFETQINKEYSNKSLLFTGDELKNGIGQWVSSGIEIHLRFSEESKFRMNLSIGGQYSLRKDIIDIPLKGSMPYLQPTRLKPFITYMNIGINMNLF